MTDSLPSAPPAACGASLLAHPALTASQKLSRACHLRLRTIPQDPLQPRRGNAVLAVNCNAKVRTMSAARLVAGCQWLKVATGRSNPPTCQLLLQWCIASRTLGRLLMCRTAEIIDQLSACSEESAPLHNSCM